MPINIQLQDFTATIHRTSLHNGGKFDEIHVETLIVTDQPIPTEELWYIPNPKPIDPLYKSIFENLHINPQPTSASAMQQRISDFSDAIQKATDGVTNETHEDIGTLALLSVLTKQPLTPVESTTNTYLLSYSYHLYPIEAGTNVFELKITLPFDGFIMPDNGDEIQITVVAPIGAIIDTSVTSGIDTNGVAISPQYANFPNSRKQAVSFEYRKDPTFTIRYHY